MSRDAEIFYKLVISDIFVLSYAPTYSNQLSTRQTAVAVCRQSDSSDDQTGSLRGFLSDGRRKLSAFFPLFQHIAINYPPSDKSDGFEKIFCLECLQILNALHMAGRSALKLENRYYNMYFSNVIPERSFVSHAPQMEGFRILIFL